MADKDIPLQRKWIHNSRSSSPDSPDGFTIISYNILADCYWASPDRSYPWCPIELRTEVERFPQLMRELEHHDADIICLQEVGSTSYT